MRKIKGAELENGGKKMWPSGRQEKPVAPYRGPCGPLDCFCSRSTSYGGSEREMDRFECSQAQKYGNAIFNLKV